MRFCVDADWIAKNPAKAVKLARVVQKPTLPFSADELQRLLDVCATFQGIRDLIIAAFQEYEEAAAAHA